MQLEEEQPGAQKHVAAPMRGPLERLYDGARHVLAIL